MKTLGVLLEENKSLLTLLPNNRVLCSITGHEMPPRADVVNEYLNSKKLKKHLEWYSYDYSTYAPYIVEDKKNNKQLYCKVTETFLNKIPDVVRKHVEGHRYQRLKKEYDEKAAKKKVDNDEAPEGIWVPDETIVNDDIEMVQDDVADDVSSESVVDSDVPSDEEFIITDKKKKKLIYSKGVLITNVEKKKKRSNAEIKSETKSESKSKKEKKKPRKE